ncbi:MAG: hypothetical protein WCT32_02230 [Patescibacteria group bacterium]|jgi:hypothetical protein
MLDNNIKELDRIMDRYTNDLEGIKQEKQKQKKSQEVFVSEFERLKHEIIWPTIVDAGNELTKYGHDFHVTEEKEYMDATATYHPAHITLNIYPALISEGMKKPESTPYISFQADRFAEKINIMVSTMMPGQGGVVGQYGMANIAELNQSFIEKIIIDVLKTSLFFHGEE